jgi:hypothetical protein
MAGTILSEASTPDGPSYRASDLMEDCAKGAKFFGDNHAGYS